MAAVASIPAIKGVEFGSAFDQAASTGTKVHDPILLGENGPSAVVRRASNRSAGVEGGMSNGEPIVIRAAMKPISTTRQGIPSVDLATRKTAKTVYERSDTCAVPRAAVVAEAMVAFVIADALLEKLGGDSLDEMMPQIQQPAVREIGRSRAWTTSRGDSDMSRTRPRCPGSACEPTLRGFARTCLHRKPDLGLPRNLEGPDPFRIVCGAKPPFLFCRAEPGNQAAHANFSRTGILPVPWEPGRARRLEEDRPVDVGTANPALPFPMKTAGE